MTTVDSCPQQTVHTIVQSLQEADRRVLLFGEPGTGKSTLATELAVEMARAGKGCFCVGADPGSPVFGAPGAVCLGQWDNNTWRTLAMEAVCSLDAGRFRLPLLEAVRRLAERLPAGTVLIDGPGVVRGVAAAELLTALVTVARVDTVVCMKRGAPGVPLRNELAAAGCDLWMLEAASQARQPTKKARARARTRLWDAYLEAAQEHVVTLDTVPVLGTPPPVDMDDPWVGRQVGLLDNGHGTLAMGEVIGKDGNCVRVRHRAFSGATAQLLVRDAWRGPRGLLGTAEAEAARTAWYTPPPDMLARQGVATGGGPRPILKVGSATATLVNGVFGDPLLHLRLRHRKRSLLFDLGEAGRLPARVAHQVTDVFVSHAHFDHIAGFVWLLRSRIGVLDVCRLYGPPGLTRHIRSFIDAIHWDRIGDGGPRFEVNELHGDRVMRTDLQVGLDQVVGLEERTVNEGLLLDDPDFLVKATVLDHGIPVLAFAASSPRTLHVRKDQLACMALPVGPWLGRLKACIAGGDRTAVVELPDGRRESASALAERLLLTRPGVKLVYATDLADTPDNRERLIRLAQGADSFFCEAVFTHDDLTQAGATKHLTARACGEIATAAGVNRLIPFHFSRRYEGEAERIYSEVAAVCSRLTVPGGRSRADL